MHFEQTNVTTDVTMSPIDTVVVSDIHLGSHVSRSRVLLEFLQQISYRRLILNGDVFDDLNFHRLKKDDWRFLSYIRKQSNPRSDREVVWVIGNHDGGVAEVLSHLLGVDVHEEYAWTHGDRRFLAIHGHQFDKWINDHAVITAVASWLYLLIQKLDPHHRASRWVKRTSKKWLRLANKVAHDAIRYGRKNHQAHVVICGHTHQPTTVEIDGSTYVNSGCWTDIPSNYVVITDDGDVRLCEY
jgi:UDP-2,3-diacylglucosamine pyrophosphatase LpxH